MNQYNLLDQVLLAVAAVTLGVVGGHLLRVVFP